MWFFKRLFQKRYKHIYIEEGNINGMVMCIFCRKCLMKSKFRLTGLPLRQAECSRSRVPMTGKEKRSNKVNCTDRRKK